MPAADSAVAVIAVLNLLLAITLVVVLGSRSAATGSVTGIAVALVAVLLMGATLLAPSWRPDPETDFGKLQKEIDAFRSDLDSAKKQISTRFDELKKDIEQLREPIKPPAIPSDDKIPGPEKPAPRAQISVYWAAADLDRHGKPVVWEILQNLGSIAARIGGADIFFCPTDQPTADQRNCVPAQPNPGCRRTFLCERDRVSVAGTGGQSAPRFATVPERYAGAQFRIALRLDCTDISGNQCTLASGPGELPHAPGELVLQSGPIGNAANASVGSGNALRFRPEAARSSLGVRR